MKIGTYVYRSGQPEMPGIILDIVNEGVEVLWVTNTTSIVPPADLREFNVFITGLEEVHAELYGRITTYLRHQIALEKLYRMRNEP